MRVFCSSIPLYDRCPPLYNGVRFCCAVYTPPSNRMTENIWESKGTFQQTSWTRNARLWAWFQVICSLSFSLLLLFLDGVESLEHVVNLLEVVRSRSNGRNITLGRVVLLKVGLVTQVAELWVNVLAVVTQKGDNNSEDRDDLLLRSPKEKARDEQQVGSGCPESWQSAQCCH